MSTHQSASDVDNLPIDIHYNKLLDWLVNRRHCDGKWKDTATVIRQKISAAIQDMPATPELTTLLEGSSINYFHCLEIVNLLRSTDSGKKNVFGQYSSQKMKDWNEIIKLYETNGVYLGETAQMLTRNVNYEITALKKQIAKCHQSKQECNRKEAYYVSQAADLKKKYAAKCKEMGIEGKKIKSELSALVSDLPSVYSRLAESAKSLEPGMRYYADFISFLMDSSNSSSETAQLSMLTFVLQNSNTTTYQWRTGQVPTRVDETSIVIDTADEQDENTDPENIDWGGGEQGNDGIHFEDVDIDLSGISLDAGGSALEEGDQTGIDFEIVEPIVEEIDWSDDAVHVEVAEVDGSAEGVAKGEDALRVLDNPKTRNLFIDDLLELEAFLMQRIVELNSESDVLSTSQFQGAPLSVQADVKVVQHMLEEVTAIVARLTSVQMQHLMLIRNSPRYVERLKDSLKQILVLADKMVFYEKEMVVKHGQVLEEQRELEPRLDLIISKTKQMQKQMESEISKKYKNRPVNIMGEINTI